MEVCAPDVVEGVGVAAGAGGGAVIEGLVGGTEGPVAFCEEGVQGGCGEVEDGGGVDGVEAGCGFGSLDGAVPSSALNYYCFLGLEAG